MRTARELAQVLADLRGGLNEALDGWEAGLAEIYDEQYAAFATEEARRITELRKLVYDTFELVSCASCGRGLAGPCMLSCNNPAHWPPHASSCGTKYRGCAPQCAFSVWDACRDGSGPASCHCTACGQVMTSYEEYAEWQHQGPCGGLVIRTPKP